jgi:hypothetical protein
MLQASLPEHGSESESGSTISHKTSRAERPKSVIYVYIAFIFKKNIQNAKLVVVYMKTCIFVLLVDES